MRSVLLRAQGKQFCTGADLEDVRECASRSELAEFMTLGHEVLRRLEASPLPVVAACQGLCLAGGLELMLACDVVFAARDARFGDQHAQFGLVPGWGGTQRLPRLMACGARSTCSIRALDRCRDRAAVGPRQPRRRRRSARRGGAGLLPRRTARSNGGLATMKRLARDGIEGTLDAGLTSRRARRRMRSCVNDVGEGLEPRSSHGADRTSRHETVAAAWAHRAAVDTIAGNARGSKYRTIA